MKSSRAFTAYDSRLSESDRFAAFRLRFLVFNLELNEGSMRHATGHDMDEFDARL